MSEGRVRFRVAPEDAGQRLDKLLAARVPGLSRRKARVLLDIGGVFVDRARVKVASRAVRVGQLIEANVGGALARATGEVGREARARDDARLPRYAVVHEDDDVIVVDKPPGLLAAPTPEGDRGNLVDLLSRRRGARVHAVHRIDLPTSGLLVYAASGLANRALSAAFRDREVGREYLAVVAGTPTQRALTGDIDGRRAVTHIEVVEPVGEVALIRARLDTGRTHQIRIHCERIDHPVMGDRVYGSRTLGSVTVTRPPRLALHAATLAFAHPRTGAAMTFSSPWPADLDGWLSRLRAAAPADTTEEQT